MTNSEIKVNNFLFKALYYWPLYVLTFLLALAGTYLYLRYSKPVYLSTSKIYIKDERKSGGRDLDALKELSLFGGSNKVVENEMEVIKSPIILQDVIAENKFNIRYFAKGRVRNQELYQNSAVVINVHSAAAQVGDYLLDITMLRNNYFKLEYIEKGTKKNISSTRRLNEKFFIGKDLFSLSYYPQFNLEKNDHFQIKIDSILPLTYAKTNQIRASLINKQSSVIELSYEDEVAKRAGDFLNAVLQTYNQYTLNDKNRTAINTMNFIETRLASLGKELNSLEREVEMFKTSRGITQVEENSRLFLEQVKEADQKLDQAKIELSVYDQIEKRINNPNIASPVTPISTNVDQALVALINRYEELVGEKRRLSLSLQETNPIVTNLESQIKDTRNTIKDYISGYRRNASTAKQGLQQKVNKIEGMISQIPAYEREYINLKRQQSVKEALYLYLLQKREESSVTYASNIVDNKIISPAYTTNFPIKPKGKLVFLAFVLSGIVLNTGYIFLKHRLNLKVLSKKEVESYFNIPVIAEVFKQEGVKQQTILGSQKSLLTEQILNLRTNLKFLLTGVETSPVILLTSSISGEGKTFLSAHLANILTYNEKRVILVELDLRKPKLSKSLGINNSNGITNYIIGLTDPTQIIQKVPGNDRLYLVPSGPIPPNPIEMLESEKLKGLLEDLKKRFDYIIIDTSPIGLVTDAKTLTTFIDCALFVVRFNYTPKAKLAEVADNIEGAPFKKMGVIFNGVEIGSSFGDYGYGYKSYGYGESEKKPKSTVKSFLKKLKNRFI